MSDTDPLSSEDEISPVPKVVRKRTKRGLKPLSNQVINDKCSVGSSLYTLKAEKSAKRANEEIMATNKESIQVDAKEVEEFFNKNQRKNQIKLEEIVKSPKCIDLDDDEEEVDSNDDLQISESISRVDHERERSPTPPPEYKRPRRKQMRTIDKRMNTALSGIEHLREQAKQFTKSNVSLNDSLNDSDIICLDDDADDEQDGKSIMLKVRCRSGLHRIEMKMDESFNKVVTEMCKLENVREEQIVMFIGDTSIQPYDTPSYLKLQLTDIIECHILKSGVIPSDIDTPDDTNTIKVFIQSLESKTRNSLFIHQNYPLQRFLLKYAHYHKLDYKKISFKFDGEYIDEKKTAEFYEMDNDDVIDVIISK